jgi:hypothetical protein
MQDGGKTPNVAVPFRLISGDKILSFISTTTVFGTPIDVTLSELAVESFFQPTAKQRKYCGSIKNKRKYPMPDFN